MSKKTRRVAGAALATCAAFAMVAPNAFAWGDDDAPPIELDGRAVVATDGPVVVRVAGQDRIETAIKALCTRPMWRTNGEGPDHLILADSMNYADALASAPLADILDAPILVTAAGDSVDPRIISLLVLGCDGKKSTGDDRPFDTVTITSGTGVLTDKVVKQLRDPIVWKADGTLDTSKGAGIGLVDRYAGANRYQTSTAIARVVSNEIRTRGGNNVDIFFADGQNFPDALAAGAAAAEHNGVVLLTMGAGGLDESTFTFASNAPYAGFFNLNHRQIWAVGGAAAAAMPRGFNGQPIEQTNTVVGSDRYETATMLASQVFGTGANAPRDYVVTSGENYADAVFAGGYAANIDAPLVLTPSASLSPFTANYLKTTAPDKSRIIVFGGNGSVTPAVQGQIVTAVTKL